MRGGEDAPPSQAGGGEDAPPSQTGGGEDAPPSQTGGREGSEDAPLIITSDEELEGEDAEVTCAFSGEQKDRKISSFVLFLLEVLSCECYFIVSVCGHWALYPPPPPPPQHMA